jgi:2-phosphosulfolactate phosphatase
MRIDILDFVAGAREARGLTIVIDVFRAFSFAPYAVERGARVIPVASIEDALAIRQRHPDWLAAGERHARRLPGFNFGNSPAEIEPHDFTGRTLLHTTHAGTQGLTAASHADEVLTGSLVNAAAIVRYAQKSAYDRITIVRMGQDARERCMEDDLCAKLLHARLLGQPFPTAGIREELRQAPAALKFFDPDATWAPEHDFEMCTDVDRFDFVLRLGPPDAEGLRSLERLPVD